MAAEKGTRQGGCPLCSFFDQFQDAEVHVLNATKEILLAIRAVIDHEIEMTNRSIRKKTKAARAEKVEIE